MACDECIELLQDQGITPDCKACGKVYVLKANYKVLTLIDTYPSLIVTNGGSININGILTMLDLECIPKTKYKEYILKITTYINALQEAYKKLDKLEEKL